MKSLFLVIIFAHFSVPAFSAVSSRLLQRVTPVGVDLDRYPDAKKELIEHIRNCGEGVVKGARKAAKNRCRYQIELDEYFFKPLPEKTGFIYDPAWPYEEGAQWITATVQEKANLPERWDLSDNSEMIRIVRQECGDCWAQATRANLEQLVLSWTGVNAPLSTQTLISSCANHGSCSGGYMTAPDFAVKYGLPFEERDPYQGRNSKCKFSMGTDAMDYKLHQAPYVGNSLNYSRAIPESQRTGPRVEDIMANMLKFESSAVVTIKSISQSGGIITSCSAINSGGNHMQDVVGWYHDGGELIARVQNSHGTSHGQNGYTHLKWECGEGQLNRGLGRSARIGIFFIPTTCTLPDAYTGPDITIPTRGTVRLGRPARVKQQCEWKPSEGLSNPHDCHPTANPDMATEYHLASTTSCGTSSAMVLVRPSKTKRPNELRTPHGVIPWSGR